MVLVSVRPTFSTGINFFYFKKTFWILDFNNLVYQLTLYLSILNKNVVIQYDMMYF